MWFSETTHIALAQRTPKSPELPTNEHKVLFRNLPNRPR